MEENNKMTLEFEDGEILELDVMGLFDVKGVDYIALLHQESDDVYLYRYVANGDSFELEDIPEKDYKAVEKSYPHFFNDFNSLGGNANVINDGK